VRKKLPTPEAVLEAVVTLADDGFCTRSALVPRFRGLGERDLRRAVNRAERQGLILERRGPDGRIYLSLTSEGWDRLRAAG
jgi:DNA-binding MarR family transcriptional regulator